MTKTYLEDFLISETDDLNILPPLLKDFFRTQIYLESTTTLHLIEGQRKVRFISKVLNKIK